MICSWWLGVVIFRRGSCRSCWRLGLFVYPCGFFLCLGVGAFLFCFVLALFYSIFWVIFFFACLFVFAFNGGSLFCLAFWMVVFFVR